MSVGIFSLDAKVEALNLEIEEARKGRREPGSALHRHYQVLQAIAADLRARQPLPRNDALADLEAALRLMKSARTNAGHYDQARMIAVAEVVVGRWPVISQALEKFKEEQKL